MTIILETERLYLRTWESCDANPYWAINQDPRVIEFLRGPLTMEQVNQFITAFNLHQEKLGYTLWAAELKLTGELIGYIGLNNTDLFEPYGAPFTPAVEVGWRLGSQFWGHGYATEGAKAALDFGFNTIGLEEIVSFTVPMNHRSIRVMEKIGLQRDWQGDFRHPKLALDHPLSQHVLYRLKKSDPTRHCERSEAKRSEAKRSEAKRSEAKRSEAKRSEAKRSEAKRSEAKRSEAKRSEAKRSEAKRSEAKRSNPASRDILDCFASLAMT